MIDLHENREAEQAVIGSIVIDQRAIKKVSSILSAEDFTVPVHIALFEAAVDIDGRGKAFDPVIAVDVAKTKLGKEAGEYVVELARLTPTSANVMAYAEIVRKHADLRRMRESLSEALMGDDPKTMAGDIIGLCQEFLQGSRTNRVKTMSDILLSMYAEKSQTGLRIDTGLSKVDWLLKGMGAGNLIIVAARPGVGKSALGMQIARYAAYRGHKTMFFSMEMSQEEVAERFVARGGVAMDKLIDNDLSESDWAAVGKIASALSTLPIMVIDDPRMSVAKIRSIVRSEPNVHLVVVDYLTLMETKGREKRYQEIGEITRGLKVLAAELKIPIVVLAQLSRNKDETEEPSLRDLRESGDIEQDANKIIMLWNLDTPDALKEKSLQRIGCKIAKNRRGKKGVVVLMFDGAHMTLTEVDERYEPPKRRKGVFDD